LPRVKVRIGTTQSLGRTASNQLNLTCIYYGRYVKVAFRLNLIQLLADTLFAREMQTRYVSGRVQWGGTRMQDAEMLCIRR
jgi:hypothetical protein